MESSTFWALFYRNLYCLFIFEISTFCHYLTAFLLKSLPFHHLPIQICTVPSLFHWNLHFFFWTLHFLCKSQSPLSLHFSFEISTFSSLFHWNLLCHFAVETSTFSSLFYCNLHFLFKTGSPSSSTVLVGGFRLIYKAFGGCGVAGWPAAATWCFVANEGFGRPPTDTLGRKFLHHVLCSGPCLS